MIVLKLIQPNKCTDDSPASTSETPTASRDTEEEQEVAVVSPSQKFVWDANSMVGNISEV